MKRIFVSLLCLLLISCKNTSFDTTSDSSIEDVKLMKTSEIIKTTGDQSHLLKSLENTTFELFKKEKDYQNLIKVNISSVSQEVDSFGAALTHASAHQLLLDKKGDTRLKILNDLFSKEGANFNTIRVPIGASDFISEGKFFTCCDEKGPNENSLLLNFNLEHDKEIISVIKEIYEIKPNLKIIAVPWSAPDWMKFNSHASKFDKDGYKLSGGQLLAKYNQTYAEYLAKFVEEYEKLGIRIDYLSIINEPYVDFTDYPCMYVSSSQAKSIIKNLEGMLVKDVKILAYDHNCEPKMYTYLDDLFKDDNVAKSINNIAIHGYGEERIPDALDKMTKMYPNNKIYMTELTEHEYANNFANNLAYCASNTTLKPYNHGLSGSIYWNIVLDSQGQPSLGQHTICYGVISMDIVEEEIIVTKNSAYYALAQTSKLLDIHSTNKVNALRVDTTSSSIIGTAFIDENDNYIVSLCNVSSDNSELNLLIDEQILNLQLEPKSIISLKI